MADSLDRRPAVPRGLIVLGSMAAAIIVLAGFRAAAWLVGPAFLALVVTICVHPIRGWLGRHGWPTWLATTVCVVVVYSLILGLAVAVVLSTARFATLLPTYADQFNNLVDDISARLESWGIGAGEVGNVLSGLDFGKLAGLFEALLGGVLDAVSSLAFILMLLLFLTVDATTFPILLARARASRPTVVNGLESFSSGTRRYFVVSTIFGFIVAVIDTIALLVLGIPVPVLWGLLAFITNYIPNIGFVIGLIPPAVLGLLEGGWSLCLTVIIVYCLINLVIQSIIQPKFVGDAVGLSTTLTFLSLVFWAWLLGGLGALLAIPLSLLVKAMLVDTDPDSRWLSSLLSNRADDEEPAGEDKPAGDGESEAPEEPEHVDHATGTTPVA
jgi:AI-2 transport protein TqsA